MATLTNTKIKDTYDGLLKTTNNEAIAASGVTLIEDGLGNASALSVGRANNGVTITGNLAVDTNTLYVDASSNRVGVGTSSPLTEMHLKDASSDCYLRIEAENTSESGIQFGDSDSAIVGRIKYDHSVNEMSFRTNGTERIIIDSSGVVNIAGGTLELASQAEIIGSSDNLKISADPDNVSGGSTIEFLVDGSEKMRIDNSGNLGIGTSSPTERLTVEGKGFFGSDGTGNYSLAISNNDQSNARIRMINTGSGGQTFDLIAGRNGVSNSGFSIYDVANAATRLRIDSSGNVGIGSSSPVSKLTLEGERNTNTLTLRTTNNDSAWTSGDEFGAIEFYSNDTSGGSAGVMSAISCFTTQTSGSTSELSFSTSEFGARNVERMRILSSGGITFNGDTAAANALDDYEEGTWTPEVADAETGGNVAAGGTYNGHYTKIGRQVTVVMQNSNIDTTGMTAGNDLWIRNLPFASGSLAGSPLWVGATRVSAITASADSLGFQTVMGENTSAVRIFEMIDSSNSFPILVSSINSGASDIWITLTYFV